MLALRDVGAADLLLTDLLWKRHVEILGRDHLVGGVDMSKHHLLDVRDGIFIVEDKEGVSLGVDPHPFVSKDLQAIVEIHHTELGDELVVGLTKLN